jgi:hypothetical protein
MKTYKCFILDADFHIRERLPIDCEGMSIAAELRERRRDTATIEVWDGARLVQRLARAKQ